MLTFYQIQVRADIPEENRKIDRDPARAGDDFDENKFRLYLVQFGKLKFRTYPEWPEFDRHNVDHVRALNRWRWKMIVCVNFPFCTPIKINAQSAGSKLG
jgi:hypothetical protein